MTDPAKGTLLIANPFLKDLNFLRTVVLICDHNPESGSFGFVLNKPFPIHLNEMVAEITNTNVPVYIGGPVQEDSLHFIHQYPDIIDGGEEIIPGIFWGGNFETIKVLLNKNELENDKIRFFLGYSGWSEGQLKMELDQDSWITTPANKNLLFDTPAKDVWTEALRQMGGDYEKLIHYPLDPQLN